MTAKTAPAPAPRPAGSAAASTADIAITPFAQALRGHFPSREELLREARAQTRRQRRGRQAGATLALLAGVAALVWADPAWRSEQLATAVGAQARHALADGSELVLNTGTLVRVETRLFSRRFVLEQGEAAFHVAHGWRPFLVDVGDTRVRDIGTVFSIRRLPQAADITVLQGEVEVRQAGRAPLRLRTGQQLQTQTGTQPARLRQVDPATAGAWQEGRLWFDGTPLATALQEVQRYRSAPIVLADREAGRLRLSGGYDVQALEALIDALPQGLPVAVQRAGDGSVRIASAPQKKP